MIDVLFVCYGNICRSPTAEALLDARLRELLGPNHDVVVASAGVGAVDGYPPTKEAVASAAARGVDMSKHRSQRLSPALAKRSSHIYCMERSQVDEAQQMAPESTVELLGEGVEDPIGCTRWVYDSVADKIDRLIRPIAEKLAAERNAPDAPAAGTHG